jgi:predicted glycogen debranching enzyme
MTDGAAHPGADVRIGPAGCTGAVTGGTAEWLLTDGLGGYAMGTASGLRTRRYHGLLVVTTEQGVPVVRPTGVAQRYLALAALDPVVTVGTARYQLATGEWAGGVISPAGCVLLSGVEVRPGSVVHRWVAGDVVIEREVAMVRGRPAVGVVHRVIRAPGLVRLALAALGTWRDAHGDRHAGHGPDPECVAAASGAIVENAWRVQGPGFVPGAEWYRGARYRQEAARGLADVEDLWHVGTFFADLGSGQSLEVQAWAGALGVPPPPAGQIVAAARARASALLTAAGLPAGTAPATERERAIRTLVTAADHHITSAPGVVAGYPWFGEWSRDTMTSYEGLFLSTGRIREGAALLRRYAATVSEGMLANTADTGTLEYNTADATLWFVHAVGRHVAVTGDDALGTELLGVLRQILGAHLAGTRYGIVADDADGLLRCGPAPTRGAGAAGFAGPSGAAGLAGPSGAAGLAGPSGAAGPPEAIENVALTWMDARVGSVPVTPRHGKPVEVNALWINALAVLRRLLSAGGAAPGEIAQLGSLHDQARASFSERFVLPGGGLRDIVDVPGRPGPSAPDDDRLRPNQLLAASLPDGPFAADPGAAARVVAAVAPLVTALGLRTLTPTDPAYRGSHHGSGGQRDLAYHQGTVWPWLIGPYAGAVRAAGAPLDGLLDGLVGHLTEAGLGSVSETADGDAPHLVTGCPFQAWSVAELLRLLKPPREPARDDAASG